MSKNKKQYQNKRTQKKPYTKPAAQKPPKEEIDQAFIDRYGQGGILKNTLKIWRDSSKATFLAYFPVILFELLYCAVWFVVSICAFIPATRSFGGSARDVVVFINVILTAVGLPLLLTYLQLRHSLTQKRFYFTNAFKYVLPASVLYWHCHGCRHRHLRLCRTGSADGEAQQRRAACRSAGSRHETRARRIQKMTFCVQNR